MENIEITQEMIDVGEAELDEFYGVVSTAELVRSVYRAMARRANPDLRATSAGPGGGDIAAVS